MGKRTPYASAATVCGHAPFGVFWGLLLGTCSALCGFVLLLCFLPWLAVFYAETWLVNVLLVLGLGIFLAILCLSLTLVFHLATGIGLPGIGFVRHVAVHVFFPGMFFLARLLGVDQDKLRRSFILLNNRWVLANRRSIAPSSLLLLLPHCIQRSLCPHRVVPCIDNCHRCGQCPVGSILQLRDTYGLHLAIVTGGTLARRLVAELRPQYIIAVACERDLTAGILDTYPLPVFGICNRRPNGPCRDTLLPFPVLCTVVRLFLGHTRQPLTLEG